MRGTGFSKVLEPRNKDTAGAILNADNWAYFICECRATNSKVRFLSKQQEKVRGTGWTTYTPDTTTVISTEEFT